MIASSKVPVLAALALAVLTLLVLAPDGVRAAGFHVNVTYDAPDANPGDFVCETEPGNGECTLRAAVMEANQIPGADLIILGAGEYQITIGDPFPGGDEDSGAFGDIDILDDLHLKGAGAGSSVIVGGFTSTLDVHEGVHATISGVAVEGANISGPGQGTCGSAVRNLGTLDLSFVQISDNFGRHVGAVCNHGTLTIEDSSIFANRTGLSGLGGGIHNRGDATLTRVSITGNAATFDGGGIFNSAEITIRDSLIAGNGATGAASSHEGGGVFNNGAMTVINTTISDNYGEGGGIANRGTGSLINVTITGNRPEEGDSDGGILNTGDLTLVNTIVANNEGGDCAGPITSAGHNLDSDGSCSLESPGDLSGVDPLLGELADNGGPTRTHAPLDGSPAIDAGDDGACPQTDQRGAPRPADGDGDTIARCDIGAYEAASPVPPPTPSPTPTVFPSKRGDIDCDGDVDSADALGLLRFLAGLWPGLPGCPPPAGFAHTADSPIPPSGSPTPPVHFARGDLNCDGSVGTLDALTLLRYVAGLPLHLPPGCAPPE